VIWIQKQHFDKVLEICICIDKSESRWIPKSRTDEIGVMTSATMINGAVGI